MTVCEAEMHQHSPGNPGVSEPPIPGLVPRGQAVLVDQLYLLACGLPHFLSCLLQLYMESQLGDLSFLLEF